MCILGDSQKHFIPTLSDSSSFKPEGTSIIDVWCLGIGSKMEMSLVVSRIRQQQVENTTGISDDQTSLKISKLLQYRSDRNSLKYDYFVQYTNKWGVS